MDNPLFWLLVFPLIIIAVLWYLGFITTGLLILTRAFKSKSILFATLLSLIAIGVIAYPFVYPKAYEKVAEKDSKSREQQLNDLPRYDVSQNMPRYFVNMSKLSETDLNYIKKKYKFREFYSKEDTRLKEAYEKYRRTEYCIKHIASKKKPKSLRKENLHIVPSCGKKADNLSAALDQRQPAIYFIEGFNTAYRLKGPLRGKIYELRYVTPTEDYLIDYFEQRTIKEPRTPANPFSSGRDLDWRHTPPERLDFIKDGLSGEKANTEM